MTGSSTSAVGDFTLPCLCTRCSLYLECFYLASSPLCSANSSSPVMLRHRLTFSRKISLSFPLQALLASTVPQRDWSHGVMALYVSHVSIRLSVFPIGPSGSQTQMQKSHMEPPTLDLSDPRNEARESAFLLCLILGHCQVWDYCPIFVFLFSYIYYQRHSRPSVNV